MGYQTFQTQKTLVYSTNHPAVMKISILMVMMKTLMKNDNEISQY
jgi:hypothetical protein